MYFLKKFFVYLFYALFQAFLEGGVQSVAVIPNAPSMHYIIQM